MSSYQVIQVEQRSPEWHQWRAGGISASDTPVILSLSPYKTPWLLWAQKKGYLDPDDLERNPHVRRGIELEDTFRQVVEKEIGDILLPVCVESTINPLFRASLDGFDAGNRPHELKCPCEKQWIEVCLLGESSKAYQLYYSQVQHQLLVTGADHGYLHFGFMDESEVFQKRSFKILRDDAMIADILRAGAEFWDFLANNIAPSKDKERDFFEPEGADAVKWKALANESRSVQSQIDQLQAQLDALKERRNDIQADAAEIMGDFKSGLYAGLQVTRVDRLGVIDHGKAIRTLLPQSSHGKLDQWLEDFRKKGSQYHIWSVSEDNSSSLPVFVPLDQNNQSSGDWF